MSKYRPHHEHVNGCQYLGIHEPTGSDMYVAERPGGLAVVVKYGDHAWSWAERPILRADKDNALSYAISLAESLRFLYPEDQKD